MRFADRIEKLPPYLFAQISKKVAAKKAEGIDVISFGIGDPDLPKGPNAAWNVNAIMRTKRRVPRAHSARNACKPRPLAARCLTINTNRIASRSANA